MSLPRLQSAKARARGGNVNSKANIFLHYRSICFAQLPPPMLREKQNKPCSLRSTLIHPDSRERPVTLPVHENCEDSVRSASTIARGYHKKGRPCGHCGEADNASRSPNLRRTAN